MDIVFGENSSTIAARSLQDALRKLEISGTLYLGYPVLSTADAKVFVDALLVSRSHGLIAFDLSSHVDAHPSDEQIANITERQNQIYASIYNKLNTHRDLRKGRNLGVTINVLTCHPSLEQVIQEDDVVICPPDELSRVLENFGPIQDGLLRPLNSAVQRVSTLRPLKRRENVTKVGSRGDILKRIEKEIANLDQWQNRGAIEYANGPQRIRGLAGSGKTVVLALKAAYLHARHPEWKIAVTFQSRSLYQQFRDLIRRFMFDQIEDEPDWSNLLVMHAWGSNRDQGIYSSICNLYDVNSLDWRTADSKYGRRAFEGACDELNTVIEERGPKKLFDAVLIDEAQDFPTSFFRVIYNVVPSPHRIMWAYDDLQNLGDYEMRSEHELFGLDSAGRPLVTLRNEADRPKEDIVLPVCYRNTPWTLATAHALGFGLYRPQGLVQMFEEPSIWPRIGYEVVKGRLQLGQPISVRRSPESYPSYFVELLNPDDAIMCEAFDSAEAQYASLADAIWVNLHEDELDATDILVVLPSAYTSRKTGASVMAALAARKINAHLVGVTTSRDELFFPNSVAVTHIFRAKGNEAPMVYIVNAEFCQVGFELSRKRNILFTGITRSRCWVRLLGVGPLMKALKDEVEQVRKHQFDLEFKYPTEEELKQLARVHRDMTDQERKDWERKISDAEELFRAVIDGDLPIEALPPELQKSLNEITTRSAEAKGSKAKK
ncbi:DEAD/DEAH box helicase [Bradyrhizobium sp. SZCCHNS3004]|uniref:DEAD/DEAH box helicase n=1 Tax=Bradyrhizobium sp. SZCCHNS3004 TaxID=3057312 RepID=UPI0029161B76|nr:ATP-binding domain-containing protein [Bradyrhizobium sp. SZCCHNS3004]